MADAAVVEEGVLTTAGGLVDEAVVALSGTTAEVPITLHEVGDSGVAGRMDQARALHSWQSTTVRQCMRTQGTDLDSIEETWAAADASLG